jgi:hypothetical protein
MIVLMGFKFPKNGTRVTALKYYLKTLLLGAP